jgi:hypothetical protein
MKIALFSHALTLFALGLLASCNESDVKLRGPGTSAQGFQLTRMSIAEGAIWEINRPIEFKFNDEVDFKTVGANTISVTSSRGAPATGQYYYKRIDTDGDGALDTTDETTIVFQPNCPVRPDLSDAGLRFGGVDYRILVPGRNSRAANTVRSKWGAQLEDSQQLQFTTPATPDPASLFIDTAFDAPEPVVRNKGAVSVVDGVSYVEVGKNLDPQSRVFFEFDPEAQTYGVAPGHSAPPETPLNEYSDQAARAAIVVEFNQAVDPSATNISEKLLHLEVQDSNGSWLPVDTRVELVANCTRTGATVRLEPVGLLPVGGKVRAVVLPGFRDLVGQTRLFPREDFAVAPTRMLAYTSLARSGDGADGIHEEFLLDASAPDSLHDAEALFTTAPATWKDGRLRSAFASIGETASAKDFDWIVRAGDTFVFDTTETNIVGGPNGDPVEIVLSRNGIVEVNDFHIEAGGTLRVQGPNPLRLDATGEVRIDGVLDASGHDAANVASLNTGDVAESGGAGVAGGGNGGNASAKTTGSTSQGGPGEGPFGQFGLGGQGGESGFAPHTFGKDARRPGGGGGGRFGPDFNNNVDGLHADRGRNGHQHGRGAVTGTSPAQGGSAGIGPFVDADNLDNDFFGIRPLTRPDGMGGLELIGLVRGELTELWAGYGGGGGGDALPSNNFPSPDWEPGSDEKGGAGGGGGGGLQIRALGPIVFGFQGLIRAEGGSGATGENTLIFDHVGGSGGSGSGGHVVLESATRIDFTGGFPDNAMGNRAHVSVQGGPAVTGPTEDPNGDDSYPQGISHGGTGGPGVIQLHVPRVLEAPSNDPVVSDIVLPTQALNAFNPLNQVLNPGPKSAQLLPTFGKTSRARSKWISIGSVDIDPDPAVSRRLIQMLFGGVETAAGPDQGRVRTSNGVVQDLPPLLGPEAVPSATVIVPPDGVTLTVTGSSLAPIIGSARAVSDDVYLRCPALLRGFLLRIEHALAPATRFDFDVVDASYDDAGTRLTLRVDGSTGTITGALATIGGNANYRLVPRFFRIRTGGVPDALPPTHGVRFRFDATGADAAGHPDEGNMLISGTGDVSSFNALLPGELKFFRFEVEFDLDAAGTGLTPATDPIVLDFLKIPFRFSVPTP